MESKEEWTIEYTTKASKQIKQLMQEHPKVYANASTLTKELVVLGPIRKNWPNFGPLKKDNRIPENSYHCHIKSGKPTYVVCWRVENKKIKIVEIFYVGTHEKAPY